MIWKIKDAQYEFQKAAFAVFGTWINSNEMVASHDCEEPQGLIGLINHLIKNDKLNEVQNLCAELLNNGELIYDLQGVSFSLDRTECSCTICQSVKYAEYQVVKDEEETQRSLEMER